LQVLTRSDRNKTSAQTLTKRKKRKLRKEKIMTKAISFAIADALTNEARKLSNANKIRMSKLAVLARQERVAKFLTLSNVAVSVTTDLYMIEKVIKFASDVTQEHATGADFTVNSFVAIKTAILNAETETFNSDLLKAAISNNFKLDAEQSKMCYFRPGKISAPRQEQMNVKFIDVLNIAKRVSKTQMKIDVKSYALKFAIAKMSDMTV
jgi:hypothetical protein